MKKKILLIILIILIFMIAYIWYSTGSKKDQSLKAIAPITAPAGKEDLTVVEDKSQSPQAKEIIRILSLLNRINLDADFFNNNAFKSLNDFSVQLPSLESGRNNPFATIETGKPLGIGSE